jgi:hypothetical protein
LNGRRVWSVEEANSLVPRLNLLVGQQLLRANEIERDFRELRGMRDATESADEAPLEAEAEAEGEGDRRRSLESALSDKVRAYEGGWREVEELGVVVKDPRIGLCDFYGRVDGKLVWLCWRYGEESVGHYHDLDAGFAGRKPLAGTTRKHTLN